jgi:hypothetical protein
VPLEGRHWMFEIEALRARHGDCLLVHFGDEGDPKRILFDGGPHRTYRESLRPRLLELASNSPTLPLELIVLSHIDRDHITGLIDLCEDLTDGSPDGPPVKPKALWHNTFERQMQEGAAAAGEDFHLDEIEEALFTKDLALPAESRFVIESVSEGDTLREKAEKLNWPINTPFDGAVRSDVPEADSQTFGPLSLKVIGPNAKQLAALYKEWPNSPEEMQRFAADPDPSPTNLSSIVCLLECDGKSALMTGDALDSDILAGLEEKGALAKGGSLELDLLKVPHHGSSHNASVEFFERLPARHYIFSADGKDGNPDLPTLEMLLQARPDDDFTLHLTYEQMVDPEGQPSVDRLHREKKGGRKFGLEFPAKDALSLTVPLSR